MRFLSSMPATNAEHARRSILIIFQISACVIGNIPSTSCSSCKISFRFNLPPLSSLIFPNLLFFAPFYPLFLHIRFMLILYTVYPVYIFFVYRLSTIQKSNFTMFYGIGSILCAQCSIFSSLIFYRYMIIHIMDHITGTLSYCLVLSIHSYR